VVSVRGVDHLQLFGPVGTEIEETRRVSLD
jgi:hypothetical protein